MELSEFGLYPLTVGGGAVALSPIPGRSGNYEADLTAVLRWEPHLVLTMTTQIELDRMEAGALGEDLKSTGVDWVHLPVIDFGAPGAEVQAQWPEVSAKAAGVLTSGGRILVHCFGGCGRSGMVALRLMVEAGEDPAAALDRLRAARACAVERDAQFEWAAAAYRP